MALILSNKSYHMGFRDAICDILFNAYTYGGEEFVAADVSMAHIAKVYIEPVKGYTFEFDYSNNKIKVFKNAPPIIIEEVQTIASNEITLNYPAAAILNMASGTATQLLIEPSDTVDTADEVQLAAAMLAGVRPTFTFHNSTSGDIKTTYITQAWQEVWVNRIASKTADTLNHIADAGETLCFVESMLAVAPAGNPSSRPMYLRKGDTVVTLECEVDFADSTGGLTGDTSFTFVSGDTVTSVTYTGIILPASGFLKERFIEDETAAMTSGTGYSAFPILFQAFCGQLPDKNGTSEEDPNHLMMPSGDGVGDTGECAIDWHLIKTVAGTQLRTKATTSSDLSLTYVKGLMSEIPGLVPLEVPDGTDLSALSGVKAHILGR